MKSLLQGRIVVLLAAVIFAGAGCRKLDYSSSGSTTTTTTGAGTQVKPTGGKGGGATLKITPNHDGINVDSVKMYIKYDAEVVPYDKKYDDSVWAKKVDGKPVATFAGLKPGNYYLFGRGWDIIRSEKVEGGMPFTILEDNKGTTHSFVLAIQNYE